MNDTGFSGYSARAAVADINVAAVRAITCFFISTVPLLVR
jgi:hypothetical protein